MATMTIAQALASTDTNITVVDNPQNIAANASNAAFVARVASFTLNANSASGAIDATKIAALGSKFSLGGFRYIVRGAVADLNNPTYAAGVALSNALSFLDTAPNLLAAATTPKVTGSFSVLLSVSASLTGADIAKLAVLPNFSMNTGQFITAADTGANLLTVTTNQKNRGVAAFKVAITSTVTVAEAQSLVVMPQFAVLSGVTLTVAGAVSQMTTSPVAAGLPALAAVSGIVVSVSDTLANLLANISAITTLKTSVTGLVATMTNSPTVAASDLTGILAIPAFRVLTGQTLTVSDTVVNLAAITTQQAAIVQAAGLSQADTATVQQLVKLLALPGFTKSVDRPLTVVDTLANVGTVTSQGRAAAGGIVVADTMGHLLAASSLPTGVTGVRVLLDSNAYTVAQGAALLTLLGQGKTLSLAGSGNATDLKIQDTLVHLTSAQATLSALAGAGSISILPTDANGTFTAAVAASLSNVPGFDPADYTLSVADTGAALSAVATQIFGHGFATITVTTGKFSGLLIQLLDPALRFSPTQSGNNPPPAATAELSANATINAEQSVRLGHLPGFAIGAGVVLTLSDTMLNLIAAARAGGMAATDIVVTNAPPLSAADAATLANMREVIGPNHFNMGSNVLVIDDLASEIADPANARGISMATTVRLSDDSIINATEAMALANLGSKFQVGGFSVVIFDTVAHLTSLAQSSSATAAVNGWGSLVLLSNDATLSLAATQVLATLNGVANAARHITISDIAANLIASDTSPMLHSGIQIRLSADATVSVADMAKLVTMPTLSLNGHALVVRDTPEHLATLAAFAAQLATSVQVVTKTLGNVAEFTIDAAELRLLANLSHLSNTNLTDTIVVLDSAQALAGIASIFSGSSNNPLRGHVTLSLAGNAVLDVASAIALAATNSVSLNGRSLQVLGTPTELVSSASAQALALATQVGLSVTAVLSVEDAALVVGVPHFTDGAQAILIRDTPANLLTLSQTVVPHASQLWVTSQTSSNLSQFHLTAADVTALAALGTQRPLSFAGFSGVITVEDTAAHLVALSEAFQAAAPGSGLSMIHAASHVRLSAEATVNVTGLEALLALPEFDLHGHPLILVDSPERLLSLSAQDVTAMSAIHLGNTVNAWVVSAADAMRLVALPNFSAGTPGMRVSDTAQEILDPHHTAGVSAAIAVVLTADAVVSANAAVFLHGLSGFSAGTHTLTIRDTAATIAALDPDVAAMATSVEVLDGAPISVALFVELRDVQHLAAEAGSFTVSDTAEHLLSLVGGDLSLLGQTSLSGPATVTAEDAADLASLPHFGIGDRTLTVTDTAEHLLQTTGQSQVPDFWAGVMLGTQVRLSADATITMAQARTLGELGLRFANNGHALIVEDVPSQLQSPSGWSGIAGQITGFHLLDTSQPWTVTAATAAKLSSLVGFDDGSGMAVVDTVGNLLAPANANGLTAAVSVAPLGDITVTVAQAVGLQQIQDFSLGGHTMTISDGGGKLATLDSNTIALASSIKLGGSSLVTVAQFDILRGLPNFSTDGRLLVISDTASHLLTLTANDVAIATMLVVSGNASLTAAEADALAELPRFSTGIAHLTVLDTAANLLHISGNADLPDNWEGEMLASQVLLTANATITAEQAGDLAALGSRFSRDGHNLTISDTPQALLDPVNAAGLAVATAITLSASTVTISALQATRLDAIGTFDKGQTVVTVSDTAANLMSAGYADGIAMANHAHLSISANLSLHDATSLIGMPNFEVNGNAALIIRDNLDDLLRLGAITLSHNDSILDATRIVLASDVQATAAELVALAALPQYSLNGRTFSRDGHALVLADTGSDIAAFTPDNIAAPTAYRMIGDDTLSAVEADILAARSTDLDGNRLTLADNPAALLDSVHAPGRALATAITLAGDTVVTAATATALFANQKFTTGGHDIVVEDSAQSLLGLSAGVKIDVTLLALHASQSVSAATLHSLSGLGILFDLNGHTLTVVDTAAHLAALSDQELALVSAQLLSENAIVDAVTLEGMAALPDFALPDGVTLTVRGSVANLLALSNDAVAISTSQQLPGSSSVVVTAVEAAALAALPHFSAPGSTIVVRDSIAHLNASPNLGWHDVATAYEVFDSIGNIVAHASSGLVTGANVVTPSGDSSIDAATAGVLAGLPNFDRSDLSVAVVDSVAEIAAHAEDILAVATGARVNLSPPATAAQAQALASLDDADMLSFNSGLTLTVVDTFAHLSDSANADGRVLAATVTIEDTVAHLLQAAVFGWGSVEPIYKLTADGSITGAEAAVLAALGGDLNLNAHTLTVVDNAAGAASHVAAILALNVMVQVTDTVAHVGAVAANLQDILDESQITSITLTNPENQTPAAAALLFPLRSVLAGTPVTVVGDAATVMANFDHLDNWTGTLGSIHVTDTAAHIAAATVTNPGMQDLDAQLIVTLTGTTTVSALIADLLVPVGPSLEAETLLNVSDTVAAVAAHGAAIAILGSVIGTITVTDSLTITAGLVSGLSEVRTHFGNGVRFAIVDTAAHVSTAITRIATMLAADRISTVTVDDETVASMLTHAANLTTATADVSILDTADHVRAQMSGLSSFINGGGALTGITLSDSGTPTIELALSQFAGNEAVMEAIDSPVNLVINDFASSIQADLVANNSRILAHLDILDVVQVADDETIALTVAQITATGVDDGAGSALSKLNLGDILVTGATVADIDTLVGLGVVPDAIAISDTAAHIQADLASGGSDLLANRALISTIVASDAGTITLTSARVQTAHVNDGSGSVLSKLSGGSLVVTGVVVADVDTVFGLGVAPASITVSDTAAHLATDLALGASSDILDHLDDITSIANSNAGAITLTAAQVLFAGVNDGAGSALSKVTGGTLIVTGATVAQIDAIVALGVPPASFTISDTAAHIQADLISGSSDILANLGGITAITVSDSGLISLTKAQIELAGVNDGAGSAMDLMTGGTLRVTGLAVAEIDAAMALDAVPDSLTVSDTAAHIAADIVLGGSSDLLGNRTIIVSITNSNAGAITLTETQVTATHVNDGAGSILSKVSGGTLVVTNALAASVGTLADLPVAPASIAVSDTAAHISTDLALGAGSHILGDLGLVSDIANSNAGAITLTAAQMLFAGVNDGAGSAMSKVTGGTLVVTGATVAQVTTLAELDVTPTSIAVSDTSAHIQADLSINASKLLGDLDLLSTITNSDSGVITLDADHALRAFVNSGAGSVFSKLTGGSLVVTGATVAQIDELLAMGVPPASFSISDTAAHIQADLISGSSDILANLGDITAIAVSDSGLISLTKAQVELAGVNDGTGSVFDLLSGGTLRVTGLTVAQIDAALALDVAPDSITVSDTAANIRADIIAGGSSNLMANRTIIVSITNSNAGAISLTEAQVTATHVNDGAGSILSKVSGGTLVVTNALVASIETLLDLPVAPASITLNDTAAHIQADLALGAGSHILGNLDQISGITNSNAGTITLTAAQLLFAGVDDGAGSALSKLSGGSLAVTEVTVAQIDSLLALGVVPDSFTLSDTAAHIQADLISGGSDILAILGAVASLNVSDAGVISLTKAQVEAASVNDFGGSAMAKMTGGTLRVTGLTVAQIDAALALGVPPNTITISDTAANIRADIISGGASDLMANRTAIFAIANSNAGAISLTEAQVTAANVNDGAGSILSKLSGGTLVITAALAASVGTLADLSFAPTSIAVSDTAAHISTDLALGAGSHILGDLSLVSGIANSDTGAITLTAAQMLFTRVNDGAGSALSKVTGGTIVVTGATVAQVETLADLGVTPTTIDVSDTAADIAADLALGAGSKLLADISLLGTITNSNAGAITLTVSQVLLAGVDDGGGSVISKVSGGTLVVTGVSVAQIDDMFALGSPPNSFTISDTAAHIQADLISGSSDILANLGSITSITVSDAGLISLTKAQVELTGVNDGAGSAMDLMTGGTLRVTGLTVAQIDAAMAMDVAPDSITVSDTAANIRADIISGGSSDLLGNRTAIFAITNSNAGAISLTEAQVTTAHVNDGAGSILSKVTGGTLVVTAALAASVGTLADLPVAPASIAVSDTAAHISADLALGAGSHILGDLGLVSAIVSSNAGTITLTAAQVYFAGVNDDSGSAMAKVSGANLAVTGVTVAQIDGLPALFVSPDSYTVSDTAANVQADLISGASDILANIADIPSIVVSDSGLISLTKAQVELAHVNDGAGSAMDRMTGGTLRVTGLTVAQIDAAMAMDVVPDSLTVSDTAANIRADIISGGSSDLLANRTAIFAITNSNAGAISLTEAQVTTAHVNDGAGSILSKVTGGTLVVTAALAASVGTLADLPVAPASIAVSDTAAHIQTDLALGAGSHILGDLGLVSGITNSNAGAITLTAAQVLFGHVNDGAGSAMSKVTGGTLVVTGATVAQVETIGDLGVTPASMTVVDTAAHVQADLALGASSKIVGDLGLVSGITVSPAGTITLTSAQVQATDINDGAGSAMSKISGGTLVVTGVAVAEIGTILGLNVVPDTITIADSAANINADFAGSADITANLSDITSVKVTDATLTVANATTVYNTIIAVIAPDMSAVTITGTAAALLTAQGTIPSMLSGAHAVTMSNNPTGVTAANATILNTLLGGVLGGGQTMQVVDTMANLLNGANAAGVALATTVELSGVTTTTAANATLLAAIADFNTSGPAVTIADTVANLLNSANTTGLAIATTVTPNANVTVTAAQLASLAAIAGFATGGHTITVQDTVANILALSEAALDFTGLVRVSDTSANVSTNLTALDTQISDQSHTMAIVLSDGVVSTATIIMTAVTYTANVATIDTITTTGSVRIIGTAAQIAAIASTLAADTVVDEVYVTDSAANVLSNLTTLNTLGGKFVSVTLSDATIDAASVAALLTVPTVVSSGALTISDTGSQIAAAIDAYGAPGLAFMNSHSIELSANSVVTASEAKTLQSLTGLSKNSHTLKVWDTASHLVNTIDGYLAAVNNASIDAVHLKTSGGSATVSPATAAALFSITNFSKNNPDSTTNTLTVSGTAANIEANYAAMVAHLSSFSTMVVSASTTVTDAVYGHLLNLGATAGGGVALTVRDTAANIAANAPTQLGASPTITPSTWSLSASATVTQANASILGGLTGFSAGAFLLSLSASVTGVSVADANKLGVLGATFRLNSNTVGVSGSVATVSTLSSAAKSVVVPHITDTFANFATLTTGDNLHGGTFTITADATITVSQANAFLALLKVGGGAGIPIANVNFNNHIASVTDTLSNIQTMTGSAGWTNNSTVHDDFHLVVSDTIANLINGANTAALATMDGTTFSSNQTTTAANAQALFALVDTIHFTKGARTLTVQDTPTNLLNLAYTDGLTYANTWRLTANATVSAIDAETLLAETKFVLNHTLTVSDTSDNLLDGVLSGAISGSAYVADIHVQLSGAETLDANTATRIVALPGFQNTGDLSIEDGSACLLNAANLAALTAATSVTLTGDETVSILTATRLMALPHFTIGSNTLNLASNDFADEAALIVIANLDSAFENGSKTIKMTDDALSLTPTQYEALQDDGINLNGHALSALATGVAVSSTAGTVHVTGTGVDDVTLKVYASSGSVLSTTAHAAASFDATASVGAIGNGIVVTEIVGSTAANSESHPIIGLERETITDFATAHSATFATSGEVQVDTNMFVDLYNSASAPASPTNPILVYNPNAHTLALHISGQAPLVLVTLGAATTPDELNDDYIFVRHFT